MSKNNCIEIGCKDDGSCEHHFVVSKDGRIYCIACGYIPEEQ